jgi:hypothetical protein
VTTSHLTPSQLPSQRTASPHSSPVCSQPRSSPLAALLSQLTASPLCAQYVATLLSQLTSSPLATLLSQLTASALTDPIAAQRRLSSRSSVVKPSQLPRRWLLKPFRSSQLTTSTSLVTCGGIILRGFENTKEDLCCAERAGECAGRGGEPAVRICGSSRIYRVLVIIQSSVNVQSSVYHCKQSTSLTTSQLFPQVTASHENAGFHLISTPNSSAEFQRRTANNEFCV